MKSNRFAYGIGTIGRDMSYTLLSMYLMFYLTEVRDFSGRMILILTTIIVIIRVFDAFNDPFMGVIVDNTKSRYGKFKPWIVIGVIGSGITASLMFHDFIIPDLLYIVLFTIFYMLWEVFYTMNDIAYWSMLPSLSQDQKEREKIGGWARIFANIGLFTVVGGIVPITAYLSSQLGNMQHAYFLYAIILAFIMIAFQMVTVYFVKETVHYKKQADTKLRDMFKIIGKNDQLLWAGISMTLFMTGYMITTSFGLHFFKYAYQNEAMYSFFGVVLGVSQVIALLLFPVFSNLLSRNRLYLIATLIVISGYILFFFSPMNIIWIGLAGILMFFGQGILQLLILVLLADTVEYGQYKLGQRNESVSFAVQPFVNKLSGALSQGVVGVTLVVIGITEATSVESVTPEMIIGMKSAMLILPLVLIVISYILYNRFYKIDAQKYKEIIDALSKRDNA
ncbi:MAG: glycoside-pentoside-hexuronide (GPH):cation symporter [Acholeplasma sp.]|jgi:melibiose permease/lactose/raffinose/galactose permease|nr:glycoside-pentoside-hexuronide (GPH):cation symporter [Acholeplasma sp.]